MAGSLWTLYMNNPQQSNSSAGLLTLTQPGASTSTTGWNVGKTSISFPFSLMSYNVEKTSGQFNTAAKPATGPDVAGAHFAQDCWRISAATTGVFSAGTWYSSTSVISVTAALSGAGRVNYRLWRSSSESGAAPTELTKGRMVGTTITALSTTVAQSSSASTQIASFSLTNEYLFMNMAWEIVTASGNNGADADIRFGSLAQTDGSGLITSIFSGTVAAPAAAFGGMMPYYRAVVQDLV